MEKYPAATVDSPNRVTAHSLSEMVQLISSAVDCALGRDKWDEARKTLKMARDLKKVPNISKETKEQINEMAKVKEESILVWSFDPELCSQGPGAAGEAKPVLLNTGWCLPGWGDVSEG